MRASHTVEIEDVPLSVLVALPDYRISARSSFRQSLPEEFGIRLMNLQGRSKHACLVFSSRVKRSRTYSRSSFRIARNPAVNSRGACHVSRQRTVAD